MRKLLFIACFILTGLVCFAQSTNTFLSKSSDSTLKIEGMYSFIDYPISNIDLITDFSCINTFVRKVDFNNEIQYYYVLKAVSKNSSIPILSYYVTMIPYEDLKKINNALKILVAKEENDQKTGIVDVDYVENKFVTERGFKIGYCIDNGKLEWFVEFDYFGAINGWDLKDRIIDNKTFILNNYNGKEIEEIFGKAQAKIELLVQ